MMDESFCSGIPDDQSFESLRHENARLIALLEAHGIKWQQTPPLPRASDPVRLTADEKIAIFRGLFRGRNDVYPVRWENKSTGKSGYTPACAHEWRAGVCEKPRKRCADCANRQLMPLTDTVIYDHLTGRRTIGIYPLLQDDHCHFLAVDFDEAEWREDARAFMQSCEELCVPAALEVSRSGHGAHIWVFC